jgi:hypothetical protein
VLEIGTQTALAKKEVAVVAIPGDIALRKTSYRKPSHRETGQPAAFALLGRRDADVVRRA